MPARKKTTQAPPKTTAKRPALKVVPSSAAVELVPGLSLEDSRRFRQILREDAEIFEALKQ